MTIPALLPLYRDLLALHVFSVIVWVTGMVVLPAVYLHHRALSTTSEAVRAFIALERQIFKRIVTPSMFATWTFGILLVLTPGVITWTEGWWYVKLICVLLMSGLHGATRDAGFGPRSFSSVWVAPHGRAGGRAWRTAPVARGARRRRQPRSGGGTCARRSAHWPYPDCA